MRINTNVASLNAQAQGAQTNNNLTSSLEKLSSGLKINKASDDASGMAIADKLRMQASSVGQGIENANSGNALITIADKAMSEQSNILDTVKTKLLQAATSTTSAEGREAIRKDVQKLLEQINNISEQTTYNGVNLLNEKGADFTFQVGEKSTDTISVQTAYAVNTEGLGSSEGEFGSASTVRANNNAVIGSLVMEGEATDAKLDVKSTAGTIDIAFSAGGTVNVSDVTSVTAIVTDARMILTTSNAEDIAFLNKQIDNLTTDGFVKLADGMYAMSAGSGTFFNSESYDFNDLKVSTGTLAGTIDFTGAAHASIEKVGGTKDIAVQNVIEATIDGDSADGIAFGQAMMLTDGALAIEADAPATNGAIALNTVASASVSDSAELAVTIASEKAVQSITLWNSLASAEVVLSTNDGETAKALEDAGLTANSEGKYVWTATTISSSELNFAADFKLSNLTIEGLTKETAATDKIFIETTGAVTVENVIEASGNEEELQNAIGVQVSTWPAGGGSAAAVATTFSASAVNSGLGSSQLSGLMSIGEGGLTAETAANYMSVVDDAMTQLNTVRSDFGSTQSQMNVAINNMMTTQVNLKAAESIIRDVDYAAESANFNKQNIIAQAGTYAMSQANQVQQNVLRLLQ